MKKAFTLAEVLITLGIIGVVAAMTFPMVVENYQKRETVVRLKKAYTVLSQAILTSQIDNGSVQNWDINYILPEEFYQIYIKKYIKHSKVVGSGPKLYALVGGYNSLNGNAVTSIGHNWGSRYIILSDGMIILFSQGWVNSNNIYIHIDVNGKKKPNQFGKDMFSFVFSNKYGLQPYGGPGTTGSWSYGTFDREKILGTGTLNCNKNSSGDWCTAIIIHDNWEIKDDYPW